MLSLPAALLVLAATVIALAVVHATSATLARALSRKHIDALAAAAFTPPDDDEEDDAETDAPLGTVAMLRRELAHADAAMREYQQAAARLDEANAEIVRRGVQIGELNAELDRLRGTPAAEARAPRVRKPRTKPAASPPATVEQAQ